VQTVCGLSVVALSLPVLALATMAWFQVSWAPWAPWAALVVGPVVGLAVLTVGVRAGSELFRRRQADLLHDLVSMR
jgi:ABC-2 type transport system permease protein